MWFSHVKGARSEPAKQAAQGRLEFRGEERVTGVDEPFRDDAGARKEEGVRHLAPHREAEGEGRDGKRRRAR